MRPLVFIFFVGVFALYIQCSFAGDEEDLAKLREAKTVSAVLDQINGKIHTKLEPTSKGQKFSEAFDCSSVASVTLQKVPVNAQLHQLKSCISKVSDKALQSKISSFYDAVNTFSSMIPALKSTIEDNQMCCQTYQITQEEYLESKRQKILKNLMKIQPFESKLLHQFAHVPNLAKILKLISESYLSEMATVITKINQLNAAKSKEQVKYTTELNALMDTFAQDDTKLIKTLNDDVHKISGQTCPNIEGFFNSI
ncbi:uncharacterized protein LOC116352491 [Contarinia nasturtii]|uniref:uncharacterized protein LOC116352491 n=1 Tax=Contarinia nasturtii TaxID=265458 RepID=UPI0012D3FCEF|nr:uncharacterized protein LOC116352491 [Contarinia nasturtii]